MSRLDRNYELSDGHTLIQTEWYGLYTKEAKLAGRAKQTIPMTEFLRIAKTLYGNKLAVTTAKDSTGKDQLAMCGLRRRAGTTPAGSDAEKEDDDEEEAGSEDDDDSDGSAGDNDESGEDEAGNESDEEQSEAAGEEQDGAVGEEQSVAGDKVDGDVDEDQDSSMQVDVQEAAAAGDNGEQRMDDVPAEVPEEMLTAQMEGVKEGSPVNATSPQRPVVSACKWHGCSAVLPHPCGPTELSRHIGVAHFAPRPVYECHWLGCKDFQPTASRTQAINHFRRHVPHIFPKVLPLNVLAATHATHPNAPLYPAPIVASKDMIGLSSIPFTAALVLRNLARAKNNRSLFWSFESDFAYAMALQSANEGMAKVLGSILYELAAKDAAEKQQEQDKEGGGEVRDGVQR